MPTYFAIVSMQDLTVCHTYEADAPLQYGGSWGDPMSYTHILVPDTLDRDCLMATREEETGIITLLTDSNKLATKLIHMKHNMRINRNQRLTDTDWTRIDDAPLTDAQRADWSTYRQALRDLPETLTDEAILHPDTIVWPTKPQ